MHFDVVFRSIFPLIRRSIETKIEKKPTRVIFHHVKREEKWSRKEMTPVVDKIGNWLPSIPTKNLTLKLLEFSLSVRLILKLKHRTCEKIAVYGFSYP